MLYIPYPFKRCTKCGKEYPATLHYFRYNQRCARSLTTWCRDCERSYAHDWEKPNFKRKRDRRQYTSDGRQICTSCKQAYPVTAKFWRKQSGAPDGFRAQCKKCCNEQKAERRKANREYKNEIEEELLETTRKIDREKHRVYYAANKEALNSKAHKRYVNNPRVVRERVNNWRKNNPEKYKAARQRRRARVRNADGNHTGDDIQKQYERQRGKCYYCHKSAERDGFPYTVEHVIPLERGGSNSPDNLVIACYKCNSRKKNKLPHEWPEGGRLL